MRIALPLLVLCTLVGCGGKKDLADLGSIQPPDAYRTARRQLEESRTADALQTFQSIDLRFAGNDRGTLEPLIKLGIADATFYQGTALSLIDAHQLYLDFVTLYSDHPRAPYAQFQAGVCALEQANAPSKDQSQTVAAFTDLREVEKRYPTSPYADAARAMIRRAESRLAEHEFLVGKFYMKRKNYVAATERFKTILQLYPRYDDQPKVYFHLAESLARSDQPTEAQVYIDKLVHDFPESPWVATARKTLGGRKTQFVFEADGRTR